ncbi:hypothetical protein IG631_15419 [Alternaria alternata]|jgi:hypothetical protein|nr:hypothetical protein IG631_15419 [Alternaria alternata]
MARSHGPRATGVLHPRLAPSAQRLVMHLCSAARLVHSSTDVLSDQGILHGTNQRPIRTCYAPSTAAKEPPRSQLRTPAEYQDHASFTIVDKLTAAMAVLVTSENPILAAAG